MEQETVAEFAKDCLVCLFKGLRVLPHEIAKELKTNCNTVHVLHDDEEWVEDDSRRHYHHHYHLILLALLNTLLPDIVLVIGLLWIISIPKAWDVIDQLVVNTLKTESLPLEQALKGLAHTQWAITSRVFTFVNKVEYFYYDWIFK